MCYSPIVIKDPSNPRKGKIVPCGKCLECRKRKQNDWCIRLTEEMKSHMYKGVFFTLTYRDDTVPINLFQDGKIIRSESGYGYKGLLPYESNRLITVWNDLSREEKKEFNELHDGCPPGEDEAVVLYSVRKKDIQDWIKRCRKRLTSKGKKFTYFLASEYGPSTNRPHYHGVFCGVELMDVVECFNDWRDKFGFVTVDDIDMSKGGIRYCSKYCSKGVYEHPFCSKDFFYWKHNQSSIVEDVLDYDGNVRFQITEYHSKHYERCMQYFGVDEPLVDPSFTLMSKGVGSGFLDDREQQEYRKFGEYELQYEQRPVVIKDNELLDDTYINTIDKSWKDVGTPGTYELDPFTYGDWRKLYEGDNHYKIMFCKPGEDIDEWNKLGDTYISISLREEIEDMINKNKYRFKNYGCTGKTQERKQDFGFTMPRYYYQKMFGETLRAEMSEIVLDVNDRLYQEKFEQLQSTDPTREASKILLDMVREEETEKRYRIQRAFECAQKQYGKSKI